ncbi:MAG TPA: VOC family protein [Sphingomicrobium sp.]|nr:VOC family protein [Sphingomicrobium sp.]
MPVLGMGGYFFRSRDPAALKAWYREHLGVGGGCGTDDKGESNEWVWFTQGGPMVFEPFKQDSDYFAADKQAMINLRVSDLDSLLASLRAAGVEVITKDEWNSMSEIGRFARIHDPEGNAIELWEQANSG